MFIVFFILFLSRSLLAAPCCGGGTVGPSLISGDDQARVTASVSTSAVIGDAPADSSKLPRFRAPDDDETLLTQTIEAVSLIGDRFQVGASLPIVQHSISNSHLQNSKTGLGDLRATLTYEFLPEWTYSLWKPHGFVFLQVTAPTGKSIYEATERGAVDATGKGFWSVGPGVFLLKRWNVWDVNFTSTFQYSFKKAFISTFQEGIEVRPGWSISAGFGVGVNPSFAPLRVGFRIQPMYQQSRITSVMGINQKNSEPQKSWDTSLELSYLLADNWAFQGNYTDQTVLGPAVNTTLSRTIAVGLQHRWQR